MPEPPSSTAPPPKKGRAAKRPHLQVILQVVHEESHVMPHPPLDGVRPAGLQALALHLQGPAVLQLSLHSPHTQQVLEHHVVSGESKEGHRWARPDSASPPPRGAGPQARQDALPTG